MLTGICSPKAYSTTPHNFISISINFSIRACYYLIPLQEECLVLFFYNYLIFFTRLFTRLGREIQDILNAQLQILLHIKVQMRKPLSAIWNYFQKSVYVLLFHFNGIKKNLFSAIEVKLLNLHIEAW